MEIFPSLISSDLLNLEKTIETFDKICDGYHIDIMDDHFVPNLTWGPDFINAIIKKTTLELHVHLMVDNPTKWPERLKLRPKDAIFFHIESFRDKKEILDFINYLKSKNIKIGLTINPETKINIIFDYLIYLDYILLMSVKPGFSGQKFMTEVKEKIAPLIKKRSETGANFKISIDGGINEANIKELKNLGIDQFCIASAIFGKPNPEKALQDLYKI